MTGNMVLSTSLLIAYENATFEQHKSQNKYKRLMKLISLPYKTNKKQLVEAKALGLNQSVYDRLLPQLQNGADRDDSLEQLATKTRFKIILTEDKNAKLPYVYYRSRFITNQLTVNLSASDNRVELTEYLRLLCDSATRITICDNYFAQWWDHTKILFHRVLPRHELEILFVETPNMPSLVKNSSKITQSFAQEICSQWTVAEEKTRYQGSHDRYLLIESPHGDVEIMISSGFDHIWKTTPKEITCVISEKS